MEIKKYSIKGILIASALLLIMASCKKNNIDTGSVNLPIVEAYLTPGHTLTVKLYQQKALTDTAKYGSPIKGQQLYLSDGSTKIQLTESSAGTYTRADSGFLVAGKTYTLQFNYLTYAVSAKTVLPTKPTNFATSHGEVTISSSLSTITNTTVLDALTWDNPDSLNHVLVFLNADGTAFALNNFGGNRPANFELTTNQSSFYNLTEGVFPYYGHYQVVLMRVNQEYINLIKSNTSNSTSQTLTNVPTNIVNGFGIFTATQADTVSFSLL